jgi:glycosyltransferase involved in cell wall biosynthesis
MFELFRGFQNRALVRRVRFDLIHIHAGMEVENLCRTGAKLHVPSFWVIGRWLSDFGWTKRPVLFTEHSQFSRRSELGFPNPLHEADLVVSEAFPNVVCVDMDAYRFLERRDREVGFARRRWFVPNGIDTNSFAFRTLEGRDSLRIGYAGRLFRRGESRKFLPDLARRLPRGIELHLAVALDLKAEEVQERWFPDTPVTVRMNIPNRDMPAFFWSIDLLVNPLLWGGVGRNSLEAMSCGRPVAMFDNADRYPVSEENGFLLPVEDVDALVSLLSRMKADKSRLQEKGRLGRDVVERKFAERHVSVKMDEVYQALLQSSPRGIEQPSNARTGGDANPT